MKLIIGVVAFAGVLVLYGSRMNGQEQTTLSDGDALTFIRAVNTAEIESIVQSKHAADWQHFADTDSSSRFNRKLG
jgi:hypothetical protein